MSDMVAGEGGDYYFDDQLYYYELVGIDSIKIWHGEQVDGIEVVYRKKDGGLFEAEHHGGYGGEAQDTIILAAEEALVRIEGYTTDVVVDRISFIVENTLTGERKTHGPYGRSGINYYYLDGLILCFFGRFGTMLDGIGAYYIPLTYKGPFFGGTSGDAWTDPVESNTHPIVNINEIIVKHGMSVDSIRTRYQLLWGEVLEGEKHGGDGGSESNVYLEEGEVIVEVHAKVGLYLNQVRFVSSRLDGSTGEYGPFGQAGEDDKDVSVYGKVIGFYGGGGDVVDALGVYFVGC